MSESKMVMFYAPGNVKRRDIKKLEAIGIVCVEAADFSGVQLQNCSGFAYPVNDDMTVAIIRAANGRFGFEEQLGKQIFAAIKAKAGVA